MLKVSRRISYLSYWFLPFVWASIIFYFSSFPAGSASEVKWQDFIVKKTAHVILYAGLTVLSYRALINSDVPRGRALIYAILISVIYGFTDEFHQSFTPGREPTLRDVLFDTIGASISGLFLWKLLPIAPMPLKKLAKSFQLS